MAILLSQLKKDDLDQCIEKLLNGVKKIGSAQGPEPVREFLLFILSAVVFSIALIFTDFADKFYDFTRAHEPWELDELVFCVAFVVTIHLMVYSIRRWFEYRHLYYTAHTDPLTGILNRRRFLEVLEFELGRARRYQRPLALAMMDIDHFKKVNDEMGHPYGDRVLKEVANLIRCSIRRNDFVARWGGEEFLILMVESDMEAASLIAERIREALEDRTKNEKHAVTISGGVALMTGDDTEDAFIRRADALLYQAKKTGRNRIVSEPGT